MVCNCSVFLKLLAHAQYRVNSQYNTGTTYLKVKSFEQRQSLHELAYIPLMHTPSQGILDQLTYLKKKI